MNTLISPPETYMHFVTYNALLSYFIALAGLVIVQSIGLFIFFFNKYSSTQKYIASINADLIGKIADVKNDVLLRVTSTDIKCQQTEDMARETQNMVIKFTKDYQILIDNFANKNTQEHIIITETLEKTSSNIAANLADLHKVTREMISKLGEHLGYHEGLKEGTRKL